MSRPTFDDLAKLPPLDLAKRLADVIAEEIAADDANIARTAERVAQVLDIGRAAGVPDQEYHQGPFRAEFFQYRRIQRRGSGSTVGTAA